MESKAILVGTDAQSQRILAAYLKRNEGEWCAFDLCKKECCLWVPGTLDIQGNSMTGSKQTDLKKKSSEKRDKEKKKIKKSDAGCWYSDLDYSVGGRAQARKTLRCCFTPDDKT